MKIIGETRPLTYKSYSYSLLSITGNFQVKEWKIEYNGRVLSTNAVGTFKFHSNLAGKKVRLIAIVAQSGKNIEHSIDLFILLGNPKILSIEWQDFRGKPIGKRKVGYLDKIQLAIKTNNIPEGDPLKISVYEDDTTGDRSMGSYTTTGVNDKGWAYLYFNQLSLYQATLNKADWVNESEHEYYIRIKYKNHISQTEEKIQLIIQNELMKYVDKPQPTNMPVVIGKVDSVKKDERTPMNFTFGVFIDGTLNNMYNTELKQKIDGKLAIAPTGLSISNDKANEIYNKKGDKKYHDSSYENDLSNPAILFKNYAADFISIFKVYTEGIGTNSAPEEQGKALKEGDYKKDDTMEGPAFGMGSAGIKGKVRKSIEDVVKIIKDNTSGKKNSFINTITFDVFGFSRGAAAARHFVHVVTHTAYPSITTDLPGKGSVGVKDVFGFDLPYSYIHKMMPAYGHLGRLLKEANLLDDQTKVVVRFVGIYDTVPHHGLTQKNDNTDLGLNNVNKANYVVHMVAADEHRYNFDLVDISSVTKVSPDSGKKGGIELTYPGVHCDVGGAYVEGDGNHPYRIDVGRSKGPLEELKKEIVAHGWFKDQEMSVNFYTSGFILAGAAGNFYRLEGFKEYVSNQYSYIPLHIMAEFCNIKKVPINNYKLAKFKRFYENIIPDNIIFLEAIKENLRNYSFKGGKSLEFVEPEVYKESPIVYASGSSQAAQYRAEWRKRQKEGQARMDAEAEKKNADLKKLRYYYLHWNSSYGSPKESVGTFASGKNKPNMIDGKRKRDVH